MAPPSTRTANATRERSPFSGRTLRLVTLVLATAVSASDAADPPPVRTQIGYTEFRTDLPGGRQPNVATMRDYVGELHMLVAEKRTKANELSPLLDQNAFGLAADPTRMVEPPAREGPVPEVNLAPLDAVRAPPH